MNSSNPLPFQTFHEVIARLERSTAGISFGARAEHHLSYADLGALVRGNAAHFQSLGIRRGDRVALSLDSDAEHVVTLLALISLGAVPVSVKPRRGGSEDYAAMLQGLCARFDVRFCHHRLPVPPGVTAIGWSVTARDARSTALIEANPDDIAVVQFSSGSLGAPKAIPLRHRNLLANLGAILGVDARTPESTVYNFLPLSHDMGLIGGLLSNLVHQNPLVLASTQSFLRNPLEGFLHHRCETVPMPNFALRYLARALESSTARGTQLPADLFASVRSVYCGAEPIRHETVAALARASGRYGFDPRALIFSYGLAEATLIVSATRFATVEDSFAARSDARVIASVGTAMPSTEIFVGSRDEAGRMVPAAPGAEGGIFVRGPGVFTGYLDEPPVVHNGWFDTGDLGFVRGGELHISGRSKDLIIINGENIFPSDVEAVAARQPGVRECLVLSEDDRFYVYVIAEPGADVDKDGLAASVGVKFGAVPTRVLTGPPGTILRTTSGKPMRQAMLAQLRASAALA